MKVEMLKSQFDALEEPEKAIVVDAAKYPDDIINFIRSSL